MLKEAVKRDSAVHFLAVDSEESLEGSLICYLNLNLAVFKCLEELLLAESTGPAANVLLGFQEILILELRLEQKNLRDLKPLLLCLGTSRPTVHGSA